MKRNCPWCKKVANTRNYEGMIRQAGEDNFQCKNIKCEAYNPKTTLEVLDKLNRNKNVDNCISGDAFMKLYKLTPDILSKLLKSGKVSVFYQGEDFNFVFDPNENPNI